MRRKIPFALFFVVVTLVFTIACAPAATATNTAASGETTAAALSAASPRIRFPNAQSAGRERHLPFAARAVLLFPACAAAARLRRRRHA